ncbi:MULTISPECIES: hypothetical protein [unclassified Streptomyces]|uniref:hypothetical protein n=1 Tax=unclassified Streptomyces TaxID=2593676 RepID=UPI00131EDD8D|nr:MULTISPECIES: hypothetical protein [unclassified Streptomyces]
MDDDHKRAGNQDGVGGNGHDKDPNRQNGANNVPGGNGRDPEVTEKLGALERRMAESRTELRSLGGAVESLVGQLGGMETRLGNVTDEMSSLRTHVTRVEDEVRGVREDLRRMAVKVDARAELARLLDLRERRFAQRDGVRDLARSLVDAFTRETLDDGLIDRELIKRCVSEKLLYERRFWLAPALAHIAATWESRSDMSHLARGTAMRLNKHRTYLFVILMAARTGDHRQAGSTMDPYLDSIDPSRLTQDFLVVLEAIANEELGPQAEKYAVRRMNRWYAESRAAADGEVRAQERQERWRKQMWSKRVPLREKDFAALRTVYQGEWPALVRAYEQAAVAEGTLAYLGAEFSEKAEPRADLRHTDRALEHLISRLEPDEAELQARIDWQQLLIDTGDVEEAERERELRRSVDAPVMTFEQLLDNAVFKPSHVELGTAARRLALRCVWPQIESVATAFVRESLRARPQQLTMVIDDWQHTLPTDPRARVDEGQLQSALAASVEEATRRRVERVRQRWPRPAAAVAGAGALVLGFAAAQAWLVVAVLVAVGWGAYELGWVPAEQRRRQAAGVERSREVAQLLRQALDQRRQLFDRWEWYGERLTVLTDWLPSREERSP